MDINRRGLLTGLISSLAAPAICKAEFLMPVKKIIVPERMIIGIDFAISHDFGSTWVIQSVGNRIVSVMTQHEYESQGGKLEDIFT